MTAPMPSGRGWWRRSPSFVKRWKTCSRFFQTSPRNQNGGSQPASTVQMLLLRTPAPISQTSSAGRPPPMSGNVILSVEPVQCRHIADYYSYKQSILPCIGYNYLRIGYTQWALGQVVDWNNLYEL